MCKESFLLLNEQELEKNNPDWLGCQRGWFLSLETNYFYSYFEG